MRIRFVLITALALGLLPLTGCGGNRLSEDEFDEALRQALLPLYQDTSGIPLVLGKRPYTPQAGRDVMRRQAQLGESVADDLDTLRPPEEADDALDEMVVALRERAEEDRKAAKDANLSEEEFRRAICCTPPAFEAAAEKLSELGYKGPVSEEER